MRGEASRTPGDRERPREEAVQPGGADLGLGFLLRPELLDAGHLDLGAEHVLLRSLADRVAGAGDALDVAGGPLRLGHDLDRFPREEQAGLGPPDGSAGTSRAPAGLGTGQRDEQGRLVRRTVARIPHDFRRTAVRNLELAGVPRSAAMAMVGHRTESVYRRYAIVDAEALRLGAERLAKLHEAQAAGRPKVAAFLSKESRRRVGGGKRS